MKSLKSQLFWFDIFSLFDIQIKICPKKYVFVHQESSNTIEIICKYCHIKLSTDKGKKPFDRINEHLSSGRHKRLKRESEDTSSRQPTLEELQIRQKQLEQFQEGVIYDFIYSICLCGLSICLSDGPLGKRLCSNLSEKNYLITIFFFSFFQVIF